MEFDIAGDACQRSAQLVAHVCEEVGLHLVGADRSELGRARFGGGPSHRCLEILVDPRSTWLYFGRESGPTSVWRLDVDALVEAAGASWTAHLGDQVDQLGGGRPVLRDR